MITNAIHSANTEHEVLFLLTTYVEAARTSGRFHFLAESSTPLPLNGTPEVRMHLTNLLIELDAASRNLDDYTRDVLHEAVHIFGAGLEQIVRLERRQHARFAA
jgi:hypothetical protein